MPRFPIDLFAAARRFAEHTSGTQRVIECDQSDSNAVVEMLRAQGWESSEIVTDEATGRTAIAVNRDDVADDDAAHEALEASGFDVSVR